MTARHIFVNHLERAVTAYLTSILAEPLEKDDSTADCPPDYWGLLDDDF